MTYIFPNIYLSELGIRHTRWYANRVYDESPDNNSMFGIANMLDKYAIPCECVRVPSNEIKNLSTPFITLFNGRFSVASVHDGMVSLVSVGHTERTISVDDFLAKWDGVALIAEPDSGSVEPDYRRHLRRVRIDSFRRWVCALSLAAVAAIGGASAGLIASPWLVLAGLVPHGEVMSWYAAADVGVLPSYTEQCSFTGLEMMARRLPVVASDGHCVSDMFTSGVNAVTAHISDDPLDDESYAASLADALDEALSMSAARRRAMLGAATRRVLTDYSPQAFAAGYSALFDSL